MSDVTRILNAIEHGDAQAGSELLTLVYDELRRVAAHKMANEAPGHTLQPTALVHEAWLHLGGDEQPIWKNRAHFFGAAAQAMRRILVDRARAKQALKRGGDLERMDLDDIELASPMPDDELLALDEALYRNSLHRDLREDFRLQTRLRRRRRGIRPDPERAALIWRFLLPP